MKVARALRMTPPLQPWDSGLLLRLTILFVGLQAVACGVWARTLARARGHSGIKWFCLGFLFSAVGVIGASRLTDSYANVEWCRRRNICSCLCAFVNGCRKG